MPQKLLQKFILRLLILFVAVTAIALLLGNWLDAHKTNHFVIIGANTILFLLSCLIIFIHAKAAAAANPNVFVRSIMAAALIKLMCIMAALGIYVFAAGKDKSVAAIIVGVALYIPYTVIEKRAVLELNKLKNGKN